MVIAAMIWFASNNGTHQRFGNVRVILFDGEKTIYLSQTIVLPCSPIAYVAGIGEIFSGKTFHLKLKGGTEHEKDYAQKEHSVIQSDRNHSLPHGGSGLGSGTGGGRRRSHD
jgi:hypothetical protein